MGIAEDKCYATQIGYPGYWNGRPDKATINLGLGAKAHGRRVYKVYQEKKGYSNNHHPVSLI
jgi:hypothetical protein